MAEEAETHSRTTTRLYVIVSKFLVQLLEHLQFLVACFVPPSVTFPSFLTPRT